MTLSGTKRAREETEVTDGSNGNFGAESDPYFLTWDLKKWETCRKWKDCWELVGNTPPPPSASYCDAVVLPRTYEAIRTWFNGKVHQVRGKNVFVVKLYDDTVETWSKSRVLSNCQNFHYFAPCTKRDKFLDVYKDLPEGDKWETCRRKSFRLFIYRWMEDPERSYCDGYDCLPNPVDAVMRPELVNTWSGYRFEVDGNGEGQLGGDAEKIIARFLEITELVTGRNAAYLEWMLNWLASIIQRPWVKQGVMPVLIDPFACGKGVWSDVVCAILGQERYSTRGIVLRTSNPRQFVFSKYNNLIKDCTFVHISHVNACTFGLGAKTRACGLAFLDAQTVTVTSKRGGKVCMRSCHHFLGNANDATQLPPIEDPRILRIQCSPAGRDRPEFWKDVDTQLRADSAARTLFWWLKRRNIDGFCAKTKPVLEMC